MKSGFKLLLAGSLLLLLALGNSAQANNTPSDLKEFTKTIDKQFDLAATGWVDLTNRHGKIDVKTWAKNSVQIIIRIKVEAASQEDAQSVFDRITFNFSNTRDKVFAETLIEPTSKRSSWWSWSSSSSDKYTINYEVYMPAEGSLRVDAKYCDVYAAAIGGRGEVTAKYGNVKLDGLGEDSNITIGYGNGTVSRARDLNVDLAYGNIDVETLSDMNVTVKYGNVTVNEGSDIVSNSRYSNFKLKTVRTFRSEGSYDNIDIGFAEEVTANARYTNVKVAKLARFAKLDMSYGSAKLSDIQPAFSEITINGRYTDVKLSLAPTTSCTFDMSGSYADITLPTTGVSKKTDVKTGNSRQVQGTIGSGGSPIRATLGYGGMTISRQ